MSGVALNGLPVTSAVLAIPGTGPWVVDVDMDLPPNDIVPSGSVAVTIGTATLVGTVDPRFSGRRGALMHVQVVGGGGGWDASVRAQHFHNDAGVTTTAVYAATAAAVGETIADLAPSVLGPDFARTAGPASRVLAGRPWYVDASGQTNVGLARLAAPAAADVQVLDWDAEARAATLTADGIVWPGAILFDSRFDTATVRDVEQTFDANGGRVTAHCELGPLRADESSGSKLARGLAAAAREAVGLAFLRRYSYRVVVQGVDYRVTLQSLTPGDVTPDILTSVPIVNGVSGVRQKLALGSVVHVVFVDPKTPIVVGFAADNAAPLLTSIGDATTPIALATPTFLAWVEAVTTYVNGLAPGTLLPVVGLASTKVIGE